MPEDLYADEGMPDNKPTADAKPKEMNDDDKGGEAAVLPKSILAGKEFNVGDEVVLKITGMHEDSISVEYAPDKGHDDSDDAEMEPAGNPGNDVPTDSLRRYGPLVLARQAGLPLATHTAKGDAAGCSAKRVDHRRRDRHRTLEADAQ